MSVDHAILPPSSAERIVACPGSRVMCEIYPSEDTIDTQEGEATHWAGSELLNGSNVALGQIAANSVMLTDDMVERAESWCDYIVGRGPVGSVEQSVHGYFINSSNWGTPDHWVLDGTTWTLHVDDYKDGFRIVPSKGNWQLINYTALILENLGLLDDTTIKIALTIHQPRSFHRNGPTRTWLTSIGELTPYFDTMRRQYAIALSDNAPVVAGPHCRDCSARHDCEAAIEAGHEARDTAYQSVPLVMSPRALMREYDMLLRAETMIVSRRKGIEQSLLAKIQRGESVPYFCIDRTIGRTVWNDDAVANGIVELAEANNVRVTKNDVALITPKQAIKAGLPAEIVQMYSRAQPGAIELVRDDGTLAESIFKEK